MEKRILVIDDNSEIRDLMKLYLESLGHNVVLAASGSEGLKELDSGNFDVVITDLQMPDISGREVIYEAKQRFPKICAILMTGGYLDENTKGEIKAKGASQILQKPFDLNKLRLAIKEC